MNKISLLLLVLLLFSANLMAQDVAVATVRYKRTEPVSGNQLDETIELLEQQQGRKLTFEERKTVLENLINQILVLQAAEADRGVLVTDQEVKQAGMRLISQQLSNVGAMPPGAVLTDENQYKQILERQGMNVQEFQTNIRKQLLTEKYIKSQSGDRLQNFSPPTQAEMAEEYQRRIKDFVVSDSVWFKHIFFKTQSLGPAEVAKKKTKAESVYQKLINSPKTFADLVISDSEDTTSKTRGGQVGPVMKGNQLALQVYGQKFLDKLFSMNINETSGVLKSNAGFHIVQVTEKKAAQLLSMDSPDVKNLLEKVIFARKYQEVFEEISMEIISKIRDKSTINYFGEYK